MTAISDTFTEAANTALSAHTADTGQDWDNVSENMVVTAGTGLLTSTDRGTHGMNVVSATANYWVEVTGRFNAASASNRLGVLMRYNGNSAAQDGYIIWAYGDDGNLILSERDSVGGNSDLKTDGFIPSFDANTDYTLRIEHTGTNVIGYVDDVQYGSFANANVTAAGAPGIYLRGAATITSLLTSDNVVAGGSIHPQIITQHYYTNLLGGG